eukprot:gi/632990201/ref/XP_007884057.1/ PREDICTED: glyoxylate reductase/hydroxypyruvate reductase-like [Callorhinchus milii]
MAALARTGPLLQVSKKLPVLGLTRQNCKQSVCNRILYLPVRSTSLKKSLWMCCSAKNTEWQSCTLWHNQCCTHVAKQALSTMTMSERPYILSSKLSDTEGIQREHAEIIKKHFNIIWFDEFLKNKEELANKIQVVFLWGHSLKVDQKLLQSLPRLKAVVSSGVGVDHLHLPLISSFGVKVTNTPHLVDNATADMGMALMLASARNVIEGFKIATSPETQCMPWNWVGVEVTGATLGIIGMGRIGYKVAQRAKGFDMKILYHNRNRRTEEEERVVDASYCAKIDDLLWQSDFVMVVVNLTPQTLKLIGERELSLMKPTGTLVNISRGAVVDQDALVKALQNGTIRAAALDVTDPEPLPRDHPLLKLPNAIITPHLGTATDKTTEKMLERMIRK